MFVDFLDELGAGVTPVSAADIRDDRMAGVGMFEIPAVCTSCELNSKLRHGNLMR